MSDVMVREMERPVEQPGAFEHRMEAIRRRAYELFEERQGAFGELDDWLTAEKEILGFAVPEFAEKDDSYEVELKVPGFTAENIEVNAKPHEIEIRGEVRANQEKTEGGSKITQYNAETLLHHYDLVHAIDEKSVTAKLEGEVLKVRAPKLEAFKAKPLPITVAAA